MAGGTRGRATGTVTHGLEARLTQAPGLIRGRPPDDPQLRTMSQGDPTRVLFSRLDFPGTFR
jgi:hypothetical protein